MSIFLLRFNNTIVRAYTTKEKMLKDYIEICKNQYRHRYQEAVNIALNELYENCYNFTEEHRLDLIKFVEEKEYQGIFTLDELEKLDLSFMLNEIVLDL
jgi:hypothetical protein